MTRVLVINGPNLNILGKRSLGVYGSKTLREIEIELSIAARELDVSVDFFQSNSEGAIIDYIQNNSDHAQAIIINPGGLTHYSYSLRDSLVDTLLPVVEIHLSNIYAREQWRRHSVISDISRGQVTGLGWRGYIAALRILADLLKEEGRT